MKKRLLIVLTICVAWFVGCNSNGINPYGYSVKYAMQERTDLNQTLHHIGKLYYKGNVIMNDIGYASVSPNAQRVIFVYKNKLYYSHMGRIQQIELTSFSTPSDVVWKKYEAVIMFPDRNSETYQLF